MTDPWERRVHRAAQLEKVWPHSGEILGFYRRVAALQGDIARRVAAPDSPIESLAPFLDPLLDLVAGAGPEVLAREAVELLEEPAEIRQGRILGGGPGRWWASGKGDLSFFTRVLLQPWLAARPLDRVDGDGPSRSCPFCGGGALVGLLREDRSAGARRRTLQCSLCSREWDFARVLCPGCGEDRPEKLPRYEAEEIPWVRVEACDSCMKYLKAVDFTKGPEAEPVVDELASTPLDVVARERGYAKLVRNFAGL